MNNQPIYNEQFYSRTEFYKQLKEKDKIYYQKRKKSILIAFIIFIMFMLFI